MSNALNLTEATEPITLVLDSSGTASVTLDYDDLVTIISISVASGTCTLKGSGKWRLDAPSDTQTLSAGSSVTIPSKGPNAPIVGLVITAVGGITNLLMSR